MEVPGRPLPDRPVGTPTVEVRHVLDQHATQMPLVQDQKVIQTFGSGRSHPSHRDGVGLGRFERGAHRCAAQVADPAMEGGSVATVSVIDEKARWLTIPTASLDDLPFRPLACRVARGSDVHDLPTGVMRCAARDDLADQGDEDHDDRLHAADGRRRWAGIPGFPRPTRF